MIDSKFLSSKRFVAIVSLLLAFVIFVLAVLFLQLRPFGNKLPVDQNQITKDKTTPVPALDVAVLSDVEVAVKSEFTSWTQGSVIYKVYIDALNPKVFSELATAYTLSLNYDPKVLKVEKTYVGDIWTDQNLLQKENDLENKKVILTIGKGFEKSVVGTGNSHLASFDFVVIGKPVSADSATQLSVTADSLYAKSGKSGKLIGDVFQVKIN